MLNYLLSFLLFEKKITDATTVGATCGADAVTHSTKAECMKRFISVRILLEIKTNTKRPNNAQVKSSHN
jgi:hypothetical protein